MSIKNRVVACIMSIALLLPAAFSEASPMAVSANAPEMRGLWVATVYNIDYPSKGTTDPGALKREAVEVLDRAQSAGINAIFLQVRPTADALYSSAIFPWSKYLTGKQGTAPADGFDPLAYWIAEAHNRGMQLHAWINPYRITKKGAKDPAHDFSSLTANHPARLHPEWVVKHTDGNLYFNPGLPETRKLITDAALEIIQNYAVDGIHMDDYFYPGQTFDDAKTYAAYGKGFASIHDWRRDNVNQLVKGLSDAIKATGKPVAFGISPFGIWANKATNSLGSDTKGLQSYYDHYADTRKWVKENTLDYIAPQIYWNIGFAIADYSKLANWWQSVVMGSNVKLYIGHATYRVGNTDVTSPWYGVEEIRRQLALNASIPEIKGSIFYNATSFKKFPELVTMLQQIFTAEGTGAVQIQPTKDITFARPSGDVKTRLATYFICGTSDPAVPLLVNGVPVTTRSTKGYFGYYATLVDGVNTFQFSQGSATKTLKIVKDMSSTPAGPMKTIEIPVASAFPQAQEERLVGEKIKLSCKAPIGSVVTVKVNGKAYKMVPAVAKTAAKGAYATTYSIEYTLPTFTGNPRAVSLGKPVYTMTYAGSTKTRTAPAGITAIMPDAPYYAKVTVPVADTYAKASSSDGAAAEVYQGMTDRVTGMTGAYVRLASGLWIKKEATAVSAHSAPIKGSVKSVGYQVDLKQDILYFDLSHSPLAVPAFDGATFTLTLNGVQTLSELKLPENALFEAPVSVIQGDKAIYSMKLKAGVKLEGYKLTSYSNGLLVTLKRKPTLAFGPQPLQGIKILIDPGHGGQDSGAIGPLGPLYAEKHVNLDVSLKLRQALQTFGATVEMTRSTDTAVTLSERLAFSRQIDPDLFISIHANSVDDSANINNIFGFSVHYKEALAKAASTDVLQSVITGLARKDRGINVNNFYVTRGAWAPSLLIEAGFMPNPQEFEWLSDPTSQEALAQKLAEAVLVYYSKP